MITARPTATEGAVPPAVRRALTGLAALHVATGAWAFVAPASFFVDFPVPGLGWVAGLPPFNDHLVRDFGNSLVALGLLGAAAGLRGDRRAVLATLAVWTLFGALHLGYHLGTFHAFGPASVAGQASALVAFVLVPAVLFLLTRRSR
jgi:hypothetical protein